MTGQGAMIVENAVFKAHDHCADRARAALRGQIIASGALSSPWMAVMAGARPAWPAPSAAAGRVSIGAVAGHKLIKIQCLSWERTLGVRPVPSAK